LSGNVLKSCGISGRECCASLTLLSANSNRGGIHWFYGEKDPRNFKVIYENRTTVLVHRSGKKIISAEHLNAAALAFPNCEFALEAPQGELPLLDGSAKLWKEALEAIATPGDLKFYIPQAKEFRIKIGDRYLNFVGATPRGCPYAVRATPRGCPFRHDTPNSNLNPNSNINMNQNINQNPNSNPNQNQNINFGRRATTWGCPDSDSPNPNQKNSDFNSENSDLISEGRATTWGCPNDDFGLQIQYTINRFNQQFTATVQIKTPADLEKILLARTFIFEEELQSAKLSENLRSCGLLLQSGVQSDLRFENEPAYHKILDFLGDISLHSNALPIGKFTVFNGGHELHHTATGALMAG